MSRIVHIHFDIHVPRIIVPLSLEQLSHSFGYHQYGPATQFDRGDRGDRGGPLSDCGLIGLGRSFLSTRGDISSWIGVEGEDVWYGEWTCESESCFRFAGRGKPNGGDETVMSVMTAFASLTEGEMMINQIASRPVVGHSRVTTPHAA
jgi:hypothetical protein